MPDLHDLLESEAHRLRPVRMPPFDDIVHRLRRRDMRNRAVGVAAVAAVTGAGVVAVPMLLRDGDVRQGLTATGNVLVLARGEDGGREWRVVATSPDNGNCIRYLSGDSEQGACDLSVPARLDEVVSFAVTDAGSPLTVVAGPAPEVAAGITVITSTGRRYTAPTEQGWMYDLYALRLPPGSSIETITATAADGSVVAEHTGPPPPPPDAPAPGGGSTNSSSVMVPPVISGSRELASMGPSVGSAWVGTVRVSAGDVSATVVCAGRGVLEVNLRPLARFDVRCEPGRVVTTENQIEVSSDQWISVTLQAPASVTWALSIRQPD